MDIINLISYLIHITTLKHITILVNADLTSIARVPIHARVYRVTTVTTTTTARPIPTATATITYRHPRAPLTTKTNPDTLLTTSKTKRISNNTRVKTTYYARYYDNSKKIANLSDNLFHGRRRSWLSRKSTTLGLVFNFLLTNADPF